MRERVAEARDFWATWDGKPSPWPAIQTGLLGAYVKQIGECSNYYAIDGGEWPPKALVKVPTDKGTVFVTAGVSIRPQPAVEMAVEENPEQQRRIELGICLGREIGPDAVKAVMNYISAQTNYPWERYAWLGEGHTFPCDSIPSYGPVEFPAVLLTAVPGGTPTINLPSYRGDPVNLLWLIPITGAERSLAEKEGTDALMELLDNAGHGWVHRNRHSVV